MNEESLIKKRRKTMKLNLLRSCLKNSRDSGDLEILDHDVSKMSIFIRLGTGMNMYKTVYKLS